MTPNLNISIFILMNEKGNSHNILVFYNYTALKTRKQFKEWY